MLRAGASEEIAKAAKVQGQAVVPLAQLLGYFEPAVQAGLLPCDLSWYRQHLDPVRVRSLAYPLQVARHCGVAALEQEPSVTVGTIHSVKGGEADVVYLFPDLSPAGVVDWLHASERRNSVLRLYYVGMTGPKRA